jgi:hypothetical protein
MSTATQRRDRVLIEPAETVAKKLRASPGQWHLVAAKPLEEARVLTTTAWRIRCNYRPNAKGIPQGLRAFAADKHGEFEAVSTADQSRPNQTAPVEMFARYVLFEDGEPPTP